MRFVRIVGARRPKARRRGWICRLSSATFAVAGSGYEDDALIACVITERDNLRAQLKAAEAGLHRAWEEGRKAGYSLGLSSGNDDGLAYRHYGPGANPYPEVNHADD